MSGLEDRLRALYDRIARCSDVEFDVLRLVIREVLVSSERRRLLMARFLRGHIPPVLGALVSAQQAGEIDARHPLPAAGLAVLSAAIFPQLLARVLTEVRTPLPLPPREALASALVTVILEGLAPRKG